MSDDVSTSPPRLEVRGVTKEFPGVLANDRVSFSVTPGEIHALLGLSHFIKRFNYNNNLIGSVNLINLSILHKIKCFVFTSSIAVYGKNQLPMA